MEPEHLEKEIDLPLEHQMEELTDHQLHQETASGKRSPVCR